MTIITNAEVEELRASLENEITKLTNLYLATSQDSQNLKEVVTRLVDGLEDIRYGYTQLESKLSQLENDIYDLRAGKNV